VVAWYWPKLKSYAVMTWYTVYCSVVFLLNYEKTYILHLLHDDEDANIARSMKVCLFVQTIISVISRNIQVKIKEISRNARGQYRHSQLYSLVASVPFKENLVQRQANDPLVLPSPPLPPGQHPSPGSALSARQASAPPAGPRQAAPRSRAGRGAPASPPTRGP